jgi:adenylate kinase
MNIVILGPQGSGKGTQAEMLAEKFGLLHIETGKILRKIAESDHPWGKKIKQMMLNGELVSDDILNAVLKETLATIHPKGYLFDGTPRNLSQYELINKVLAERAEKIDRVVYLNIPEEETIKRLSSRRTCSTCGRIYNIITDPPTVSNQCDCGGELIHREDDQPQAIKKRLEWGRTTEIKQQAQKEGILLEINGEQPIEDIHKEIVERLGL